MLVQFKKDSEAGGDKIRGVLREVRWRGKCQTTYTRWARLEVLPWGTWVAQSVMHPTLGFGSGHDLTVGAPCRALCFAWSLLGILSLPLLLPLRHSCSFFLKINK